ncbi:unnamed protein product [Cuscuta campestris]|uniref:Uncharacterized protein n=1 Tax=Cuscuta campestris TaxID=132261 RepID=A0A484LZZ0_9ASTE|nr:unnamed protein product [Cuscuta campestris]
MVSNQFSPWILLLKVVVQYSLLYILNQTLDLNFPSKPPLPFLEQTQTQFKVFRRISSILGVIAVTGQQEVMGLLAGTGH